MTHGASVTQMLLVVSWDLDMPWQPTAVQHLDRDLAPYCWMIWHALGQSLPLQVVRIQGWVHTTVGIMKMLEWYVPMVSTLQALLTKLHTVRTINFY